jgi:hypothetical protein
VDTTVQRLSAGDAAIDARLFDALGRSVDFARYWQEPDECDEAIAAAPVRELLRPVADAVLACPLTEWWSTPLSGSQVHVGFVLDDRPTDPPFAGASESLRDWHAEQTRLNTRFGNLDAAHWERASGTWWSAPSHPARLLITTRILERGPVRLSLVEDSLGWTAMFCLLTRHIEADGGQSMISLSFPAQLSDGFPAVLGAAEARADVRASSHAPQPGWATPTGDAELSCRTHLRRAAGGRIVRVSAAPLSGGWRRRTGSMLSFGTTISRMRPA